jgi:hypothetical protein
MSIFSRKSPKDFDGSLAEESFEEMERNPELLAAEKLVNSAPPPPPSMNPFFDVTMGSRPRLVEVPEEEGPSRQ